MPGENGTLVVRKKLRLRRAEPGTASKLSAVNTEPVLLGGQGRGFREILVTGHL